ncbi:MAG: methyltransferase domain-containing protein [Patescibacteria group bacterium]
MSEQTNKLFDKYLSTSFFETNQLEASLDNIKHIASTYDWNYKKIIPADKNSKILDIGCGLGQFLYWLKNNGYNNYLGVDLSQEMLDFCKANVTGQVLKISSMTEFLADKKDQYDLIVLNDVIEHLPKTEIINDLALIKSALKQGGMLIVKTNNLAAITGPRLRYEDFTHEVGLTEHSLMQVLLLAGYKQVEIRAFAMPRTSILRWIRFIVQTILHQLWRSMFFWEFTLVPKIVDELIFAVAKK